MTKISVLLTTEGTYPFHQGGVSTWCDALVKELKSIDFTVFAVMTDPFVSQKFETGRLNVIRVPLWGTEEPSEHLDRPFSSTYLAKQRTTDRVIEERFLPLFDRLVGEVIAIRKNPFEFADILVNMYDLFSEFDYKVCFKSHITWDRYNELILKSTETYSNGLGDPDVYCMIQSLGWLYRFFNIVNTPIPKTTLTHSSAAAFCGLPCIISKVKYGTPFLLTEHGVYLREQYLSLSKQGYPSFLNTYLIRLIHSISTINYTFADQISPVCEYNMRWEKRWTDRHSRIRVIYNGVDEAAFSRTRGKGESNPTVVTVARIDPIKDFVTLLNVAALVRKSIPNVRFLIYGSVSVPTYYERCLKLRTELELDEVVEFCGHTTDVVTAYEQADVVLQTSVSEAFPYSVIEAMLSGRPVVSTDVGGIPEAIGDTGILAAPGDVEELSQGLITLLGDGEARSELGERARQRALTMFTLEKSLSSYLKSYIILAVAADQANEVDSVAVLPPVADNGTREEYDIRLEQQLQAERAYALMDYGFFEEAATYLKLAIDTAPNQYSVPMFLLDMGKLYEILGDEKSAFDYVSKYFVASTLIEQKIGESS